MTKVECDFTVCWHNNKKGLCKSDKLKIIIRRAKILRDPDADYDLIPECCGFETSEKYETDILPHVFPLTYLQKRIMRLLNLGGMSFSKLSTEKIAYYLDSKEQIVKKDLETLKEKEIVLSEDSKDKTYWTVNDNDLFLTRFIANIV